MQTTKGTTILHGISVLASTLVLGICQPNALAAADLKLTILARTNDVAPGSGSGLGYPDGRFTWSPPQAGPDNQFGPPVAASGGRFAFQAAVLQRDANGVVQGIHTGIWGGNQGGALTMLFRQALAAPPLGSNFTSYGLQNISELGTVAFFAATGTAPPPNNGLWWGNSGAGSVATLEVVQRQTSLSPGRPLQSANYIGFSYLGTNWTYDTDTKTLRAISYAGLLVGVFGTGLTLTNPGSIIALTTDGRLLLQGNSSDGTNRLFLVNGLGLITPVMSQGDPAPGIANRKIGLMSVSGNDQGYVAVKVGRLDDGDANVANDRSALFGGPATNVSLVVQYPFGSIQGGGTFISRSNYVIANDATGTNAGFWKLPGSTNETLSFTPLPAKPYAPLAGQTLLSSSLNALGQYVELYGSTGELNQKNPGNDLWLFNPGQGWTNVVRSGTSIVASGETIPVNDIGFVGNITSLGGTGGGYASGLADDGTLVFSVSTHLISASAVPAHDFYWTGLLNPNWHTIQANAPFTSWQSVEKNPRKQPPGDAEPGAASVFINAFPGETIVLDQRPTPIGSLTMSNGLLRLKEHLTVNRVSRFSDLRMEAPNGSLTVNADSSISNAFEWITGTVDGLGVLLVTNLFLTNGTTTRLNTSLVVQSNGVFDNGGTLILSNGVLRNNGLFIARTGTVTNSAGAPPVQNAGLLRKEGAGDFKIYTPLQAFERLLRIPPWGLEVTNGRLSLLGGGTFLGFQTNNVRTGAVLELGGQFNVNPELTIFQGDGTFELGTAVTNGNLAHIGFARSVINMGGHTANFNRGEITGDFGVCTNAGHFIWKGGRIALGVGPLGAGSFQNTGEFEIEDTAGPLRQLDGKFLNFGFPPAGVEQRGGFELNGTVLNEGLWKIVRGVTISGGGAGIFSNVLTVAVELEQPGTVTIDARFLNVPGFHPWGGPLAYFVVGNETANPTNSVQLVGTVGNLVGTTLTDGAWQVGPNCSLSFPGDIETIAYTTFLKIVGGDIPTLKLKENSGLLIMKDKNYSTPPGGGFINRGGLTLMGNSTFTVNGDFTQEGELILKPPARIIVTGKFITSGELEAGSQITAAGGVEVSGPIKGSGPVEGPILRFTLPSDITPAYSPGTLTLVGQTFLTNNTRLNIELAGTQSNRFDVLAVTGPLTLGGTLAINLIENFRPALGDTFTVIKATSITGQFLNAANGQRIQTIDGYGSLVVNYTPTSVVLSAFNLNLNPSPTGPATLKLPTFALDGTLNLSLTGSPGRAYILQSSTNLVNWSSVETNNAGFNGLLKFELSRSADPQRFFRALAQ